MVQRFEGATQILDSRELIPKEVGRREGGGRGGASQLPVSIDLLG